MTVSEQLTAVYENREKLYEAGKQAEYDEFWGAYQSRSTYSYGFAGAGWNNKTFKPKYPITTYDAVNALFQQSNITGDLGEILKSCGSSLDTKNAKNFDYMFYISKFSSVPVIDTTSATAKNNSHMFANCTNLVTIEKLILKEDGSQNFVNTFSNCAKLKEIRFSGVIGKSIDFSACKNLSYDSFVDILDHLSLTATGQTATFSLAAKTEAEIPDEGWQYAVDNHKNWTLSLV